MVTAEQVRRVKATLRRHNIRVTMTPRPDGYVEVSVLRTTTATYATHVRVARALMDERIDFFLRGNEQAA